MAREGREGPRGRGAATNPPNRFERLAYAELPPEADDWPDADEDEAAPPRLATRVFRDPSRAIFSHNDSPDLPFSTSLNPYRGCEHGCVYCLAPDTPVLHADLIWRPIGEINVGDELVGFDEYPQPGRTRKLRRSVVEGVFWSTRPTRRLITRQADVLATAEHGWLQSRDFRWSRTEQLSRGRLLRHMPVPPEEPVDDDYRVGYVAGLSLGDGTFRYRRGWRSDKKGFPAAYWRIALIDREPLARTVAFLERLGIALRIRTFDPGRRTSKPMFKVESRSLRRLEVIEKILEVELDSRAYRRGFVAGFFDAEGHNGTSLRISQVELAVLERVRRYVCSFGFEFRLERRIGAASSIRLVGSVGDRMRFFTFFRPAIRRKRDALLGRTPCLAPEPVEAIEAGPVTDVVDIQTSTRTFYAAGLATHNCYARPTHEYLGFSAGLDFESRILAKQDAPALIRRRLASRRWTPRTVAIGGVTDGYQPVERRLRLTRRCLEVFAEFRNPLAIVTKSALVVRDADLLRELAGFDAAAVYVSITSLDRRLARAMEPRAATPRRRLAAVAALARAGIPVGVMVAPVIPGLNDAEIPALVEAAARAGAGGVRHLVLRLPYGLAGLFEDWLARHFPERRQKVLARIRDVRGGRLNDARFHSRMRGEGPFAEQIHALFDVARRRAGLPEGGFELSTAHFRRPAQGQLPLL